MKEINREDQNALCMMKGMDKESVVGMMQAPGMPR
jgi:hypothetical protein